MNHEYGKEIVKIPNFSQNFRKISILAKIFDSRKSWFWSILSKYLDFGQNYRNILIFVFASKFSIISILIKIYKNLDFGQNLQKFRF